MAKLVYKNKKKSVLKTLCLGLLACSFLCVPTQSARAFSWYGFISLWLNLPVVLAETKQMDFATILADPVGDTVTLSHTGARSATGSSTFSGTAVAGEFLIIGTWWTNVTISFSSGDTLTGPGAAMPLGNFVSSQGTVVYLGTGGTEYVDIGADLTINANQAGGQYNGNYVMTVNYQ